MSIAVGLALAEKYRRQASEEIDRLRLTDAEREAVRFCSELCRMGERADLAATLRGLLERHDRIGHQDGPES